MKLALVAVAMFVFAGLNAQNPPVPYNVYDANETAPTNIDYVTLRTGGSTTMGYYAMPDLVYHSTYAATGTLTAGFVWNWSILPVMTINKPGAANYVEIVYTATGNYVVNVAEQSSAAFGGCADSNPTVMNVTVIAPPTATFTTADATAFCGPQVAQPINIRIVENIPNALAAYGFAVREVIENINELGVSTANLGTNNTYVSFPLGGKAKVGTAGFTAATPNFDYDFSSSILTVQNNLRTRYTYTLLKASDATAVAEGIISAISQKSDFIAGTQLAYTYTDNTVVFIVNPAPATGPIYHIPNNYAY